MQVPQFIPQGAIRCFSKETDWIINLNLLLEERIIYFF